jgi:hypothetical protein
MSVEEKAHDTARLQREFEALTEQAEAQGFAHSELPPATGNSDDATARLLEQIRVLQNQMGAMQQQQQHMQAVMDQGLPEYTSSPT